MSFRDQVLSFMAGPKELMTNMQCHEAISIVIYMTIIFIILLFVPHYIRQYIDRQYLKTLARKARERHIMECELQESFEYRMSVCDDDEEKMRELDYLSLSTLGRYSDEKLCFLSPDLSRATYD